MTETTVQHYEISQELRLGSGTDLFDHVADCVCHFINEKQLTDNKISLGEYAKCHLFCPGTCQSSNRWIPRTVHQRNTQKWPTCVTHLVLLSGFTFSFPITHHSLRSGFLVNWTKSFKCMDVVGKDVVQLLNKSLIKKGCYNVNIKAILNDTTGDLKWNIFLVINTGVFVLFSHFINSTCVRVYGLGVSSENPINYVRFTLNRKIITTIESCNRTKYRYQSS